MSSQSWSVPYLCVMYLSSQSNKNTRLQLLVRIYISFWQGQSQYPCVVNQVNVCWLYHLCFLALLPGWPSHLGYCFNSCHLWIRRPNRISWLTLDRTIFHLNICFVHLNNIFFHSMTTAIIFPWFSTSIIWLWNSNECNDLEKIQLPVENFFSLK